MYEPLEAGVYPFKAGKYKKNVEISIEGERYFFNTNGYSAAVNEGIKQLDGRKWHGFDETNPRKVWSAPINERNNFQLHRLILGTKTAYNLYDIPLEPQTFERPLMEHQKRMVEHGLTRRWALIGGEMGTGKTLAAIEIMERSGKEVWWFVGPRSALAAVSVELRKWNCKVKPRMMTYEGMVKQVTEFPDTVPDGIIFDESSKIKTEKSKRSLCAAAVAHCVREDLGYIILMSGTPAPKSPVDWWNQAETCAPGFLVEGSPASLKHTVCHTVEETGIGGASFAKFVAWKDDTKRCAICGEFENHPNHCLRATEAKEVSIKKKLVAERKAGNDVTEYQTMLDRIMMTKLLSDDQHNFEPGVNEVARLYKRLRGLTHIVFKKDCTDLPEKNYRIVHVQPTDEMLRAISVLKRTEGKGIKFLTKARQISDGFMYRDVPVGKKTCPVCEGSGHIVQWIDPELEVTVPEQTEGAKRLEVPCTTCKSSGEVNVYERQAVDMVSPKEEALGDLLDEFEDVGRVVIFAPYTASVDKCLHICQARGWETIKVDGRGWETTLGEMGDSDMLEAFQDKDSKHSRIAFVLNPQSGGMGLTLTASPVAIYYSNDFNGEARMQSEDRIHRVGMDVNRGATIIDMFCLWTDEYIYQSNRRKIDLQKITMGDLKNVQQQQDHTDTAR